MKRIYVFFVFLMIAAMLFTGCSSSTPSETYAPGNDSSYDEEKGYGEEAPNAPEYETPAEEPEYSPEPQAGVVDTGVISEKPGMELNGDSILQPGVNRKIVYNGTIVANTKEFVKDYDMILSTAIEFGGYVQNSLVDGKPPEERQDMGRTAQMTLRVPSAKFDSFIRLLKGVGQNLKSSVSGDDISLRYFDTETKLSTLRNRQSRLEEMLKDPAYKLDAIIELEKSLAEVSYDIQMLEMDRRNYDSLVDYSTVNITLYEVMEITSIMPAEESLGTRISNGFYSVLNAVVDFGEGLIIFLVASLPVTIPAAIILAVVLILVSRSKKRRAKASQGAQDGRNNV